MVFTEFLSETPKKHTQKYLIGQEREKQKKIGTTTRQINKQQGEQTEK